MSQILRNCIVCRRDDADTYDNGIVWATTAPDCNHAICRECRDHVLNAVLDVHCASLCPCAPSAQIANHILAIAGTCARVKHPHSVRAHVRSGAFRPVVRSVLATAAPEVSNGRE